MILYKMDSSRAIRQWEVTQQGTKVITYFGLLNSEKPSSAMVVLESNYEAVEHVKKLIQNKIEKQGYSEEIPSSVPDLPMLALSYSKTTAVPDMVYVQPKLDGIRCIATSTTMISRRNIPITSCPHIQDALKNLPPGITLDGELYIPNSKFEDQLSSIKRDDPNKESYKVLYNVFDIVNLESQVYRFTKLENLNLPYPIKKVPTELIPSHHIEKYMDNYLLEGYEGMIIRNPDGVYEKNKRSKFLYKYKRYSDYWTKIVDIEGGKKGTTDEDCAVFVVSSPNGKLFRVTPAFPKDTRRAMLQMKWKYIGCKTQIRYENATEEGIPSKARAYEAIYN
jgi:DNA ligase-1